MPVTLVWVNHIKQFPQFIATLPMTARKAFDKARGRLILLNRERHAQCFCILRDLTVVLGNFPQRSLQGFTSLGWFDR